MKAGKRSATREAWVCCSITSLTRTAYGSLVWRHGKSRWSDAYQASSKPRMAASEEESATWGCIRGA